MPFSVSENVDMIWLTRIWTDMLFVLILVVRIWTFSTDPRIAHYVRSSNSPLPFRPHQPVRLNNFQQFPSRIVHEGSSDKSLAISRSPYAPPLNSNHHPQFNSDHSPATRYDVIDLTDPTKPGELHLRGQTTKIITTGRLDDDFWLKVLGEDYKRAVHVVVSDQDVYVEDESAVDNNESAALFGDRVYSTEYRKSKPLDVRSDSIDYSKLGTTKEPERITTENISTSSGIEEEIDGMGSLNGSTWLPDTQKVNKTEALSHSSGNGDEHESQTTQTFVDHSAIYKDPKEEIRNPTNHSKLTNREYSSSGDHTRTPKHYTIQLPDQSLNTSKKNSITGTRDISDSGSEGNNGANKAASISDVRNPWEAYDIKESLTQSNQDSFDNLSKNKFNRVLEQLLVLMADKMRRQDRKHRNTLQDKSGSSGFIRNRDPRAEIFEVGM